MSFYQACSPFPGALWAMESFNGDTQSVTICVSLQSLGSPREARGLCGELSEESDLTQAVLGEKLRDKKRRNLLSGYTQHQHNKSRVFTLDFTAEARESPSPGASAVGFWDAPFPPASLNKMQFSTSGLFVQAQPGAAAQQGQAELPGQQRENKPGPGWCM